MIDHFPWHTQIQNCQLNSESNSEYIKMTIYHNHIGFILETKKGIKYTCELILYSTWVEWRKKWHGHLIRSKKSSWQYST
jgi:hypothetical protein